MQEKEIEGRGRKRDTYEQEEEIKVMPRNSKPIQDDKKIGKSRKIAEKEERKRR